MHEVPLAAARRLPHLWWYYLVALGVVVLDQWSKHLASTLLSYGRPVFVLPVFDLTLLHNSGAAFSFLAGAGVATLAAGCDCDGCQRGVDSVAPPAVF